MCHMSRDTCQVSHFLFFFYKVVELFDGGSVINGGPTPSSFLMYWISFHKHDSANWIYMNHVGKKNLFFLKYIPHIWQWQYIGFNVFSHMNSHIDPVGPVMFVVSISRRQETLAKKALKLVLLKVLSISLPVIWHNWVFGFLLRGLYLTLIRNRPVKFHLRVFEKAV